MKIKNWKFLTGMGILAFLLISYFINITEIEQEGGLIIETNTPLLGILIFYNPFILGLYILIAAVLVIKGTKKSRKK